MEQNKNQENKITPAPYRPVSGDHSKTTLYVLAFIGILTIAIALGIFVNNRVLEPSADSVSSYVKSKEKDYEQGSILDSTAIDAAKKYIKSIGVSWTRDFRWEYRIVSASNVDLDKLEYRSAKRDFERLIRGRTKYRLVLAEGMHISQEKIYFLYAITLDKNNRTKVAGVGRLEK